jgi:transcriptional regulator GlxA family with amidase domain
MAAKRGEPKGIAILALPGVQLLDVAGPLDVFAEANVQTGKPVYRLHVVASQPGAITSSSGTRLLPDFVITDVDAGTIDTLLVAGCPNASQARPEAAVIDWLRMAAPQTRRYGSVCTGAFYLAAAGLLNKKRVTTHWAVAAQLAQAYPTALVDEDALYVKDGKLRTAAGVTAGLDLALALIEEDLGRDLAMKVAGRLVMFFKRPGGQMQFSREGEALPSGRSILQEVQRFVAANPAADHSVASLAARASLSPRHFTRLFHGEVGITPAAFVESARVSAARRLLEDGRDSPKQVATDCGFANADTLRRAFVRHVGVTPAEYRKRYTQA